MTILLLLIVSLIILLISGISYQLSKNNGSDIRIVWYFFSLTTLISFGIAWTAISIGAIKDGKFFGYYGDLISELITIMLDIKKDFIIVTSIASLIIVPQLSCYVLSGLSGNAKPPRLIQESLSFVVWSFIKTLVIGSAIISSLGIMIMLGYLSEPKKLAIELIAIGLYSLLLAYGMIAIYRETKFIKDLYKNLPYLKKIHAWFTRNEKQHTSKKKTEEINLIELSENLKSLTIQIQEIASKNGNHRHRQDSDIPYKIED
ncbi:hypothetical protein [Pseudomonas oryzihabitans]|uniref:hypothetical protein n=1 Tax=Pseudomonas oryzihabitans TaxID=47885 RepID=UPI002862A557|nr:hypothetical protein [Pseudomonas psychrotolerans]MDR6676858.1 hypothetical protein [Pseudomonas psychrotolerans]